MKKLFYLHNTPLAALLALERTGRVPARAWPAYMDGLGKKSSRAGFLAAGLDGNGYQVFALWYSADLKLLTRLAQSFLALLRPERGEILLCVVGYPNLWIFFGLTLYRLGLRGAGRLCLRLAAAFRPPQWVRKRQAELTFRGQRCIIGAEFGLKAGESLDAGRRSSRR